ncbi:hypothetical protein RRG08_054089 [Elysia crispata]|uniref:Uncharacterized protein n=1 Tax=Elysia crispata TaxID=231223 RepID=A0AAE1DDY9_9GAST|nr:hypothetical protein RRG08_054089 [Elysia crispata]
MLPDLPPLPLDSDQTGDMLDLSTRQEPGRVTNHQRAGCERFAQDADIAESREEEEEEEEVEPFLGTVRRLHRNQAPRISLIKARQEAGTWKCNRLELAGLTLSLVPHFHF